MSHPIYRTEGVVLGGNDTGEGSRILHILTPDLGLVRVLAQGVRELKSKLRYATQYFSYALFELVRGKDLWRLTNAEEAVSFYKNLSPLAKTRVAEVTALVRRLTRGEEPNEELFFA